VEELLEIRRLARSELARVSEIDRSEEIQLLYEQRGIELVERHGEWSASTWDPDGDGDDSVAAKRRELEKYIDLRGVAFGAFAGERLVGLAVVVPHLRPAVAQLAFIHVTREQRGAGVGSRLCGEMERVARVAGDTEMIVSATPSGDTVRFYRGRGFEPMAEPLPELLEVEPEDVHMRKAL
jgi:GNAT superfamily N-acetyltransferase